jgi:hypothetical protein
MQIGLYVIAVFGLFYLIYFNIVMYIAFKFNIMLNWRSFLLKTIENLKKNVIP